MHAPELTVGQWYYIVRALETHIAYWDKALVDHPDQAALFTEQKEQGVKLLTLLEKAGIE